MAIGRVKTWSVEILTSSDLNAEIDNILNNGEDLAWPATKAKDLDGQELILDSDADTSITADTDDRFDFRAGGQDIVRFDGTTASSVNFLDLASRATGVAPVIGSRGESNVGLVVQDTNGNELLILGSVASAVNELSVLNAATGNAPIVRTTGEADTGIEFQNSDGEQMLILAATATSVNEVTVTSAATGSGPSIVTTGGDTNAPITVSGKGTGAVLLGQATSTDVRLAADQPIGDSSGNELIAFSKTASAVNEVTVTNAATGDNPSVGATGETNVGLNLTTSGTGALQKNGDTLAGVAQVVSVQTGVADTGVTLSPDDDTIPQIGEGDEYMTLAITPQNANSTLVIEVLGHFAHDNQNVFTMALFQDSTAGALAAVQGRPSSSNIVYQMPLTHTMTAGTTSPTTFRIRAGQAIDGSTTTFNGSAGARKLGGVMASSIVITEILP